MVMIHAKMIRMAVAQILNFMGDHIDTTIIDGVEDWRAVQCDGAVVSKSKAKGQIDVDLGLTHFVILSSGDKVAGPKAFARHEKKLPRAQRALARKQKGSANRRNAKLKVARLHARITDARRDFLHKLSTRLINENQVIAVESLSVSRMQKDRHLSKSIADVSWSVFVRQLEYKAQWYGRTLIGIDR